MTIESRAASCLPQLPRNWGRWIAATSRRDGGGLSKAQALGGSRASIDASTPSRLLYTSAFQNLRTLHPCPSRDVRRRSSFARSSAVECVAPSSSIASFSFTTAKSTMYGLIGCCVRNCHPPSWRPFSRDQRMRSASVNLSRSDIARERVCQSCFTDRPPPSRREDAVIHLPQSATGGGKNSRGAR